MPAVQSEAQVAHVCPVCGAVHNIPPGLAAMAYGRQFTCSSRCKAERRRTALQRNLALLNREEREQMERHRHMEEND